MIENGTFDDIYVGDYIIDNNGNKWLIADIDNYLYTGDTPLTKHHATIISSTSLINGRMNATNTTDGGYVGSRVFNEVLPNYLNIYVIPTFKNHIITYRNLLVTIDDSNDANWSDRQLDLMSEINVYGASVWSVYGYDTGIDNRQYAIFKFNPEYINNEENNVRYGFWLKNVSSPTGFAVAGNYGHSTSYSASLAGVRYKTKIFNWIEIKKIVL